MFYSRQEKILVNRIDEGGFVLVSKKERCFTALKEGHLIDLGLGVERIIAIHRFPRYVWLMTCSREYYTDHSGNIAIFL